MVTRPHLRRPRAKNSRLVRFVKNYRVEWAVITMVLQLAAIVLVVVVFPNVSNLWVSIFVLVGGFTASVTSLGDLLVSAEESDRDQAEAGHSTE